MAKELLQSWRNWLRSLGIVTSGYDEKFVSWLEKWNHGLSRHASAIGSWHALPGDGKIHIALTGVRVVNTALLDRDFQPLSRSSSGDLQNIALSEASRGAPQPLAPLNSAAKQALNGAISKAVRDQQNGPAASASDDDTVLLDSDSEHSDSSSSSSHSSRSSSSSFSMSADNILSDTSYTIEFDVSSDTTIDELELSDLIALSGNILSVRRDGEGSLASEQERQDVLNTIRFFGQFALNAPSASIAPNQLQLVNSALNAKGFKLNYSLTKILRLAEHKQALIELTANKSSVLGGYVELVKQILDRYAPFLKVTLDTLIDALRPVQKPSHKLKGFAGIAQTLGKQVRQEIRNNNQDNINWLRSELGLVDAELKLINSCYINPSDVPTKLYEYLTGHYENSIELRIDEQISEIGQDALVARLTDKHILSLTSAELISAEVVAIMPALNSVPVSVLLVVKSTDIGKAVADPASHSEWWQEMTDALAQQINLKQVFFKYPDVVPNSFYRRAANKLAGWFGFRKTSDIDLLTLAESVYLNNLSSENLAVVTPFFKELVLNRYISGDTVSQELLKLLKLGDEADLIAEADRKLENNFQLISAPASCYEVRVNFSDASIARFCELPRLSRLKAAANQKITRVINRNAAYLSLVSAMLSQSGQATSAAPNALRACIQLDAQPGEFSSFLATLEAATSSELLQSIADILLAKPAYLGLTLIPADQDKQPESGLLLELYNKALGIEVHDCQGLLLYLGERLFRFDNNYTAEDGTLKNTLPLDEALGLITKWPQTHRDALIKRYLASCGGVVSWLHNCIAQEQKMDVWLNLFDHMSPNLQQEILAEIANKYLRLEEFSISKKQMADFLASLLKNRNKKEVQPYLPLAFDIEDGQDIPNGFMVTVWVRRLKDQLGTIQDLDLSPKFNTKNFIDAVSYEFIIALATTDEHTEKKFHTQTIEDHRESGLQYNLITTNRTLFETSIRKVANISGGLRDQDILDTFSTGPVLHNWVKQTGVTSFMVLLDARQSVGPLLMRRFIKNNLLPTRSQVLAIFNDSDEGPGLALISNILLTMLASNQQDFVLKRLQTALEQTTAFFLNDKIEAYRFFMEAGALAADNNRLKQLMQPVAEFISFKKFNITHSTSNAYGALEHSFCEFLLKALYKQPSWNAGGDNEVKDLINKTFEYLPKPGPSDVMREIYRLASQCLGAKEAGDILVHSLAAQQQALEPNKFKIYVNTYLTNKAQPPQLLVSIAAQPFANEGNLVNYEYLLHFNDAINQRAEAANAEVQGAEHEPVLVQKDAAQEELQKFLYAPSYIMTRKHYHSLLEHFKQLDSATAIQLLQALDAGTHLRKPIVEAEHRELLPELVKLLASINSKVRQELLNQYFDAYLMNGKRKLLPIRLHSDIQQQKVAKIVNWLLDKVQFNNEELFVVIIMHQLTLLTPASAKDSLLDILVHKVTDLIDNDPRLIAYQQEWHALLDSLGHTSADQSAPGPSNH